MNPNPVEITALLLFLIGFYGLIARKNIIKSILSLGIMDAAVILFFLGIRYENAMRPPIGEPAPAPAADPVPQALMITAIVIGAAVMAAGLMMFIALYHRYGTTNWKTAHKIRSRERDL